MNKQTYYTPYIPSPQTARMGDFQPIKMETDAIVRRVSRDLYANPASGIRELLANEIRACTQAKKEGADPLIEVTITKDMIRIWGRDSLGIARDIFDNIYMTLGRSGNFDGTAPGQFGLGRAAYTTITDHILIETKHRNGDHYTVLGVEGRGYQTGLPAGDMEYGTRVTMAPRPETSDRHYSIKNMVRSMGKRSPIPITLTTERDTETILYEEFRTEGAISCKLPDIEFAVIAESARYHTHTNAYLCGIPIEYRYGGKFSLSYLAVDIYDERKYKPTPDRERLTDNAAADITRMIDTEIQDRIDRFPAKIEAAIGHADLPVVLPVLPDDHVLKRRVPVCGYDGKKSLHTVRGSPILNCRAFLEHQIDAVLEQYPDTAFVRKAPELQDIKSFMTKHKIQPKKRHVVRESYKTYVLHGKYGETIRARATDDIGTVYRVKNAAELYEYRRLAHGGAYLTVHNFPGAVSLADAMAKARSATYETTRGEMTGEQLMAAGGDVYRTDSRPLFECWIKRGGEKAFNEILVYDPPNFEMLAEGADRIHNRETYTLRGYTHALMTYLLLDNNILKNAISMHYHDCELLDEFMRLDGKQPVQVD